VFCFTTAAPTNATASLVSTYFLVDETLAAANHVRGREAHDGSRPGILQLERPGRLSATEVWLNGLAVTVGIVLADLYVFQLDVESGDGFKSCAPGHGQLCRYPSIEEAVF